MTLIGQMSSEYQTCPIKQPYSLINLPLLFYFSAANHGETFATNDALYAKMGAKDGLWTAQKDANPYGSYSALSSFIFVSSIIDVYLEDKDRSGI